MHQLRTWKFSTNRKPTVRQFEGMPHYWTSGGQAEVDFLIQHENEIIPIEVKADENVRSKSLTFYRKEFSPRLSIRYSLKNLNYDNGLVNIPFFMADYTQKIITIIKKL